MEEERRRKEEDHRKQKYHIRALNTFVLPFSFTHPHGPDKKTATAGANVISKHLPPQLDL
jgi:hypothetical protein